MTSDPSQGECFVYITSPGEVKPVTAGRYVLSVDRRGEPIGRFVYGRSYLARDDKVEIDPIELRLSDRTYETVRLKGVFGALRDAGPDFWGRRVIERDQQRVRLPRLPVGTATGMRTRNLTRTLRNAQSGASKPKEG